MDAYGHNCMLPLVVMMEAIRVATKCNRPNRRRKRHPRAKNGEKALKKPETSCQNLQNVAGSTIFGLIWIPQNVTLTGLRVLTMGNT
jgi:hypothetical protein